MQELINCKSEQDVSDFFFHGLRLSMTAREVHQVNRVEVRHKANLLAKVLWLEPFPQLTMSEALQISGASVLASTGFFHANLKGLSRQARAALTDRGARLFCEAAEFETGQKHQLLLRTALYFDYWQGLLARFERFSSRELRLLIGPIDKMIVAGQKSIKPS